MRFTLIELLVVIAIIAILAAILLVDPAWPTSAAGNEMMWNRFQNRDDHPTGWWILVQQTKYVALELTKCPSMDVAA